MDGQEGSLAWLSLSLIQGDIILHDGDAVCELVDLGIEPLKGFAVNLEDFQDCISISCSRLLARFSIVGLVMILGLLGL